MARRKIVNYLTYTEKRNLAIWQARPEANEQDDNHLHLSDTWMYDIAPDFRRLVARNIVKGVDMTIYMRKKVGKLGMNDQFPALGILTCMAVAAQRRYNDLPKIDAIEAVEKAYTALVDVEYDPSDDFD